MPRPLRKLPRPKPQEVVIRHIGNDEAVEIVAPDELARRKDEAIWQRYAQSHGLDLVEEHARLALHVGDVVTVPAFHRELWWFVLDVNGLERTITAATILFDQPRTVTWPFDAADPLTLWPIQRNEADLTFARLRTLLPREATHSKRTRRAA